MFERRDIIWLVFLRYLYGTFFLIGYLDAFDFENVTFGKPSETRLDSQDCISEDSDVSGVSDDSIRRWSIDDFVERYVAKIISDACESIKPKRPIRVSDRFAEKFIE